jgi:hypothetical protein
MINGNWITQFLSLLTKSKKGLFLPSDGQHGPRDTIGKSFDHNWSKRSENENSQFSLNSSRTNIDQVC